MTSNDTISLKEAKLQFLTILKNINNTDKDKFVEFAFEKLNCNSNEDNDCESGFALLNKISDDIKGRLPLNAILPSENCIAPKNGENADCLSALTVAVDEFLYNDDDVEELVEEGKLQRNYCKSCGSKNVEPLIFISHSMSKDAMYYIFKTCLPSLKNKTVLDIGSRLGAVLYGAYVFSDASRIIGVEMNKDLCKLQNDMVNKCQMMDRIEVLHKRIEDAEDIVKTADVILINNAFEFFVSEEKQAEIWQFLKDHIKSKTILVVRPHLETTFMHLKTNIELDEWVKSYKRTENSNEMEGEDSEHCDIAFYEVL